MEEKELKELLDKILKTDEHECVEYKTNLSDPEQIGEYISALSNSSVIHKHANSYLIWGIEDESKRVVGTKFNPSKKKVGNQALEMWLTQRLAPKPFFEFISGNYQSKNIVLLRINPVVERPVKFNSTAFVRVGSHKTKLDSQPGKLKTFWKIAIADDQSNWDSVLVQNSNFADLDQKTIELFIERLNQKGRRVIPDDDTYEVVLEKLGLISDGQLTRAAILLFSHEPKNYFPTAFIKAGRFKTNIDILDDKEIDGNLFQQLDGAMLWFKERMETKYDIGKDSSSQKLAERKVVWQYPLAALREAIVNAVCHRNYSIGIPTSIRLFDKYMEIWNAGTLPPNLQPEDLLKEHASHAPNQLIAECFFNSGLIERWGTGTLRIAQSLDEHDLPAPLFDISTTDIFKVKMFASGPSLIKLKESGLNERQVKTIHHLQINRSITVMEYQKLVGTSKPTATRDLTGLVEKNFLKREGKGRNTSYVLLD